ncbi:DUF2603 domain-containing protein [Nitrosophilus kaiyonis]|uniref:DUF2603 domain-containing protein n=1 Tax=Nitrosophilus kaiyonis TaxID=2930200 RepID=UPI002490B192|nr:DUF2603 domain-containing protein [Nitrosophilus kaiyonis]
MQLKNLNGENLLQNINKMANELGIPSPENITVVKISNTQDPDKKTLELIQGAWDSKAPWFVIGDDNKVYVLSSIESIMELINSLKKTKYENFNLKLEKAILENLPVDFNDVWVVAMQEIQNRLAKSKNKHLLDIDIKKLIKDIKKNHPNLFLKLKDLGFSQQNE